MEFIVLGLSHNTAPLEVRETLALQREETERALGQLREEAFFSEGLILSTCNRTEFYVLAPTAPVAREGILAWVRRTRGVEHLADPNLGYQRQDREAVAHLFRVASGLDSLVLGEPQILGQVKEAYSLACRAQATGAFTNKLLHMAFRVAKRARTETEIGAGAVSVASAAVGAVAERLGDLAGRRALLVGAGGQGELAVRHLLAGGVEDLLVSSRTASRAGELVGRLGGRVLPFERLGEALAEVDLALFCTASLRYVLTRELLEPALARREGRLLVLVDIAVPRDVDPHLGKLPGVRLLDIDALRAVVDANLERRQAARPRVEEMVGREVDRFFSWLRELQTVPLLQELLRRMEGLRQSELERFVRGGDGAERQRLERFSRRLVSRMLQEPIARIKLCDRSTRIGLQRLETLRDLFALGAEGEPAGAEEGAGEAP